jgi:hypothetical protein
MPCTATTSLRIPAQRGDRSPQSSWYIARSCTQWRRVRRPGADLSAQEPRQDPHEPLRIVEPGDVSAAWLHGQLGPMEQAAILGADIQADRHSGATAIAHLHTRQEARAVRLASTATTPTVA